MKYLRIIKLTTGALLYYIFSVLVPKKKNLWVFGSWKGKNYSDNSKVLFEYVVKNHPDINALWIAKNLSVYNELESKGLPVALYSKWSTKWKVIRAAANIQTESNEDTGRFRVGGTKVIQLFHGYGAVKEAYLYPGMGKLKKAIVKIYADNHSTSYWMVPSEYFVNRIPFLFDANRKKIFVTGQPRIDLLYQLKKCEFFEQIKKEHPNCKFLFYAPTHRSYAVSNRVDFGQKEWDNFNSFCKNNDYILFFKPHPLELSKYINDFQSLSNIILLKNDIEGCPIDPYEYMHYFDLMISDYSSISADFLVYDRPIVHFMYDLETFADESFSLDALNTFVAGPICKNWDDLYDSVKQSFTADSYKELRASAKNNALRYLDGNNSKRVYKRVVDITNLKINE